MNSAKAKVKAKVSDAFRTVLKFKDTSYMNVVLKELEYLYKITDDNDFRSGNSTYGYAEDNIGQLEYISDRFMVQFRLRWLIDGIRGGHF